MEELFLLFSYKYSIPNYEAIKLKESININQSGVVDSPFRLIITLKNTEPVGASDFGNHLSSFHNQYRRFLEREQLILGEQNVKLFINDIRKGSIETELIPWIASGGMLLFMENANTIIDFGQNLIHWFSYLKGEEKSAPFKYTKVDLEDTKSIIRPVVKDYGSQLNINGVSGNVQIFAENISFGDANTIANQAQEKIKDLELPVHEPMSFVALQLYQVIDSTSAKRGDKGILERISKDAIKLVFADPEVKSQILENTENPFQKIFIVDASVETIEGKPIYYTITALHEVMDRP